MKATPMKVALESIQEQPPVIRPFSFADEPVSEPASEEKADFNGAGEGQFQGLIQGIQIAGDEIDLHLERSSFVTATSSGSKREKKALAKKKDLDQQEFEEMLKEDEVYK